MKKNKKVPTPEEIEQFKKEAEEVKAELEQLLKHPEKYKQYDINNLDELFKDLDS